MNTSPAKIQDVGVMVLPKLAVNNVAVMTVISAAEIVGFQPATVIWKGKKYDGAKCYTVHGKSFKVFSAPTNLALGWVKAKSSPTSLITMDTPVPFLPGYTNEVKVLKASN